MNILEHSLSLKFATVLRQGKLYALKSEHVMKSDKVLVWTSTMTSARSWKGAFYSDMCKDYDRSWSPVSSPIFTVIK